MKVLWVLAHNTTHLAANGMNAHAALLAWMFAEEAHSQGVVCFLLQPVRKGAPTTLMGMPVATPPEAIAASGLPDVILELSWLMDSINIAQFCKPSTAIIRWHAGGSLADAALHIAAPMHLHEKLQKSEDVEQVFGSRMLAGRESAVHMVLVSPHYHHQAEFLRAWSCRGHGEVDEMPYVWSSTFVRRNFAADAAQRPPAADEPRSGPHEFESFWQTQRRVFQTTASQLFPLRDRSVLIAESNIATSKTFMIPLLACEQVSDQIDHVVVTCPSPHLQKVSSIAQFLDSTTPCRGVAERATRQPLPALAKKCNVLISHQILCNRNFLPLDCLFLGMQVVHNHEPWPEVGLYYAGSDVRRAADRIREALDMPIRTDGTLPPAVARLMWELSVHHPRNRAEVKRLLTKMLWIHEQRSARITRVVDYFAGGLAPKIWHHVNTHMQHQGLDVRTSTGVLPPLHASDNLQVGLSCRPRGMIYHCARQLETLLQVAESIKDSWDICVPYLYDAPDRIVKRVQEIRPDPSVLRTALYLVEVSDIESLSKVQFRWVQRVPAEGAPWRVLVTAPFVVVPTDPAMGVEQRAETPILAWREAQSDGAHEPSDASVGAAAVASSACDHLCVPDGEPELTATSSGPTVLSSMASADPL